MWIGVDDTDRPGAGCTTWVLSELLRVARDHGLSPLGPPRLVRLNPNIPWKTRGNAALAARLGYGKGPRRRVGRLDGRPLYAHRTGRSPAQAEADRFFEAAWEVVAASAPAADGTDPALVMSPVRPASGLYWRAVREVVTVAEAKEALGAVGARWRTRGDDRGLVGAAAAIAWPARRGTWELIAYRTAARIGTPRSVDAASVVAAQRADRRLFLCHDPRTRRLLVAPHTGCPILFGLRGTELAAPVRALLRVRSEPWERWVAFRTNQGTGDHLVPRSASEIRPFVSAIVTGTVSDPPRALPGGHVALSVRDGEGALARCIVFEPTKTLPAVAQRLSPGDRVRVWGSTGATEVLRVEGLRVVGLTDAAFRRPPRCDSCGRSTGSLGRGRGWRCDPCRRRFPPELAVRRSVRRAIALGTYHPTPSARRHLAPLGPEP